MRPHWPDKPHSTRRKQLIIPTQLQREIKSLPPSQLIHDWFSLHLFYDTGACTGIMIVWYPPLPQHTHHYHHHHHSSFPHLFVSSSPPPPPPISSPSPLYPPPPCPLLPTMLWARRSQTVIYARAIEWPGSSHELRVEVSESPWEQ